VIAGHQAGVIEDEKLHARGGHRRAVRGEHPPRRPHGVVVPGGTLGHLEGEALAEKPAAIMSIIVDRAARRGEVPAGADAAEVIQVVTAQLYYRLFVAGEPPSHAAADRAAAIAAAAARGGVLASPAEALSQLS
jgi:hypothetical protein